MSPDEKPLPLHVQVALALGCGDVFHDTDEGSYTYNEWLCGNCNNGRHPEMAPEHQSGMREIAPYDTSWEATGPLIERYAVDLAWQPPGLDGSPEEWTATAWIPIRQGNPQEVKRERGPTALTATCALILALAAAGKLPRSA